MMFNTGDLRQDQNTDRRFEGHQRWDFIDRNKDTLQPSHKVSGTWRAGKVSEGFSDRQWTSKSLNTEKCHKWQHAGGWLLITGCSWQRRQTDWRKDEK